MSFADVALRQQRPSSARRNVVLPRRTRGYPSPADWRDEVLYFLLIDRFSDGAEHTRPMLDRQNIAAARVPPGGGTWRWDAWARSGADRWQGGTLAGAQSKLGYLADLGVSALWLSPVFKQRGHLDSYHGYGVQDFLEVEPRFGTRTDLVALVAAAHAAGLRVILDVIFNHSGPNWVYAPAAHGGAYRVEPDYTPGSHAFGQWLDASGAPGPIVGGEDGVWPEELQDPNVYTRAGRGSLSGGDIDDPGAEHKRTDFLTLRDFRVDRPDVLTDLVRCYQYWVALTDCDGFRIDTLKHVTPEEARNFCGAIKEFAANNGKQNFFLVGEVAGGDYAQDRYLNVLARNLDAALDIGEMRLTLGGVAKGLQPPDAYFAGFGPGRAVMGSHRNLGSRHVSVLDDHDHVFGAKLRFSVDAAGVHQVVAGVALQLFTLGIPCLYYGTEQALAGPEPAERDWLRAEGWGDSDRYLREAMFGPAHPRAPGRAGLPARPASHTAGAGLDVALPGFGPFGTAGHHCFDTRHPAYVRIAALAACRRALPAARYGRQYLRPVSLFGQPFAPPAAGELVPWSRILDTDEVLCVLNAHGTDPRGAAVLVDFGLSPVGTTLTVVLNTAEAAANAAGLAYTGTHPVGSSVRVRLAGDAACVDIAAVAPSEVVVLTNHPGADPGAVLP